MDPILPYIILDFAVIITVVLLMMPKMSFWHPLSIYLLFHIYTFSYRAFEIYAGAPLMYAGQIYADTIAPEEIHRAMLVADLCLIIFYLGSNFAHLKTHKSGESLHAIRIINPRVSTLLGMVILPAGVLALYYAKTYGLRANIDDAGTGYIQAVAMWPIGILGILVFTFGFRWYYMLMAAAYLSVVAFQGYHRFMLILPLLYFSALYLQTQRRRWPSAIILVCAIFIAGVFPQLKPIGAAIQRGEYSSASALVGESFGFGEKEFYKKSTDELLDQFAGALTLIDENDRKFMGSTYLSVITLPVPRAWWPSKPGLADHLVEISTPGRRYDKQGRIITYIAESYLNFGYAGFILVPFIFGYVSTIFCLQSDSGELLGLWRYLYLAVWVSFLQAFRDGITSLVLFSVVHNMPMCFLVVANLMPGLAIKVYPRLNQSNEVAPHGRGKINSAR